MHSSAALRTTDMWSSVIGNEFGKANDSSAVAGGGQTENAYEMNQNLMALARLSGASKGDAKRGSCKKCGEIGHLSFQCVPPHARTFPPRSAHAHSRPELGVTHPPPLNLKDPERETREQVLQHADWEEGASGRRVLHLE